jgi:hypothetical protein
MCSCDYFVPLNYRCIEVEKDEFRFSMSRVAYKLCAEFRRWPAPGANTISAEFLTRILLGGPDQPIPGDEIFHLSSLQ